MQTSPTLIGSNKVRARYGDRSHMWIERLLRREDSGFPKPVYVGRLRFWKIEELEAWERGLAGKTVEKSRTAQTSEAA